MALAFAALVWMVGGSAGGEFLTGYAGSGALDNLFVFALIFGADGRAGHPPPEGAGIGIRRWHLVRGSASSPRAPIAPRSVHSSATLRRDPRS